MNDAKPFVGPGFSLRRFARFLKDIVKTKHFLTRIAAFVVIATVSMAASAAVIGFTSRVWSGAKGVNSDSLNGVTLTAQPFAAQTLTFNSGACGNSLVGLACNGAVLGKCFERRLAGTHERPGPGPGLAAPDRPQVAASGGGRGSAC